MKFFFAVIVLVAIFRKQVASAAVLKNGSQGSPGERRDKLEELKMWRAKLQKAGEKYLAERKLWLERNRQADATNATNLEQEIVALIEETVKADTASLKQRLKGLEWWRSSSCDFQMNDLELVSYNGKAHASSEYAANHNATNAFIPYTSGVNYPWASKTLPATVWYKFKEPRAVKKIGFTSREQQNKNWQQAPKTFSIVASNSKNCSSNWDELRAVSDSEITRALQAKAWEIPCASQKAYHCYGLKVTQSIGDNWDLTALSDIKMWD